MDLHPNIKVDQAIADIEAKMAALRQEVERLGGEIEELKVARRVNERLHGPIPDRSPKSVSGETENIQEQLSSGSTALGKRVFPTIADRIELLFEVHGPMRTQQIWRCLKEETPEITFRTVVGTLQRSKGQGRFQLVGRDWQKSQKQTVDP